MPIDKKTLPTEEHENYSFPKEVENKPRSITMKEKGEFIKKSDQNSDDEMTPNDLFRLSKNVEALYRGFKQAVEDQKTHIAGLKAEDAPKDALNRAIKLKLDLESGFDRAKEALLETNPEVKKSNYEILKQWMEKGIIPTVYPIETGPTSTNSKISPEKAIEIKKKLGIYREPVVETSPEVKKKIKTPPTAETMLKVAENVGFFNEARLVDLAKKDLSSFDNQFVKMILADKSLTKKLVEAGYVKGNRETNQGVYNDQALKDFVKKNEVLFAEKKIDEISRRNPKFEMFKNNKELLNQLLSRGFVNLKEDNGFSTNEAISYLCTQKYNEKMKFLNTLYGDISFDENDEPKVGFFGRLSGKASKIKQDTEYEAMKDFHSLVRTLQNEVTTSKTPSGFWKKALTWAGIGGAALTIYGDSNNKVRAEAMPDLGISTKIQTQTKESEPETKSPYRPNIRLQETRNQESETHVDIKPDINIETQENEINFSDEEGTKTTVETESGKKRRVENKQRAEANALKEAEAIRKIINEIKVEDFKVEPTDKKAVDEFIKIVKNIQPNISPELQQKYNEAFKRSSPEVKKFLLNIKSDAKSKKAVDDLITNLGLNKGPAAISKKMQKLYDEAFK